MSFPARAASRRSRQPRASGRCGRRIVWHAGYEDHREIAVEGVVQLAHDLEAVASARELDLDDGQLRAVGAEPFDQLVGGRCGSRVRIPAGRPPEPPSGVRHRRSRRSRSCRSPSIPSSPVLSRCGSCAGKCWKSSLGPKGGRRRPITASAARRSASAGAKLFFVHGGGPARPPRGESARTQRRGDSLVTGGRNGMTDRVLGRRVAVSASGLVSLQR